MQLSIVIPVYLSDPLHLDFTRQTVESVNTKHNCKIVIIINHATPDLKKELPSLKKRVACPLSLVTNPKGNILAAAWNLGITHALKRSSAYTLIINNDIVFHQKAIDNLVTFAQTHQEFLLWTATEHDNFRTLKEAAWDGSFAPHPHFSAFMISPKTVKVAGYFDENFKVGYFEDNDYHLRLLKAGFHAAATTTARFYHYGSRTAEVDDRLRLQIKPAYQQNRRYFQKKWGIDIHGQAFHPPEKILKVTFPTPFNNPDLSIKDW